MIVANVGKVVTIQHLHSCTHHITLDISVVILLLKLARPKSAWVVFLCYAFVGRNKWEIRMISIILYRLESNIYCQLCFSCTHRRFTMRNIIEYIERVRVMFCDWLSVCVCVSVCVFVSIQISYYIWIYFFIYTVILLMFKAVKTTTTTTMMMIMVMMVVMMMMMMINRRATNSNGRAHGH